MKKPVSTTPSESNIKEVLRLLSETPARLETLSEGLPDVRLHEPLGPGERSFMEVLAHLSNSEARSSEAIYLALLADEPLFTEIHPERQWGRLVRYDLAPFSELLAYYKFRRTILLRALDMLGEAEWARRIREEGKQRRESVYWRARALALHELEHLIDLEKKLS